MRALTRLLILAAAIAATFGLWALPNRPVPLEELPGGKLPSVSFAPFRANQSPLTETFPTREQIAEDLKLLSTEVHGVRTYTAREGLEAVPPLAREFGLTVTHSAWIDTKPEINRAEVAALIQAANAYPDVIRRVIVGNEVLLRRSQTPEQLIAYIDEVRAAIAQPVGYADVWEFWLQNPQVAEHVDFIVIHILPYWEDIPVSAEQSEERILEALHVIKERFPGKPILVGEIGWPTAGRSRGPATTGLVDKARFINMVIRLAAREGFDYNLIEAFDQPWKSLNEGTVGANWGLFSAERERKFHLTGSVVANPSWRLHFGFSTAAALALLGIGAVRTRQVGTAGFAAGCVAAFVLGSGLVWAWHVGATQTYYPFETVRAWLLWALHAALAVTLVPAVLRLFSESVGPAAEPGRECAVFAEMETPGTRLAGFGGLVLAVMAGVAVLATYLLVFNGRYRDFPIPDFAGPVLVLIGLGILRAWRRGGGFSAFAFAGLLSGGTPVPAARVRSLGQAARLAPFAAALAALLPLGALGLVVSEGIQNREALAWAGLLVLLAVPFAAEVRALRKA
ncbi:glycoside hydrolase family 17 protein [Arenibaculum pallidiluteum]|uniref:glycoside hydrolase family 17 protein n=1 Tax=Arenibaculum pallidiluteum TaxID=2812559 RepID=UPI001A96647F|nr:glycoside hydrolase [Arenibaculum pallidiluteum]